MTAAGAGTETQVVGRSVKGVKKTRSPVSGIRPGDLTPSQWPGHIEGSHKVRPDRRDVSGRRPGYSPSPASNGPRSTHGGGGGGGNPERGRRVCRETALVFATPLGLEGGEGPGELETDAGMVTL